jgi:hypothetical protein
MRMLRAIRKASLKDRIKSEQIKQDCDIQDVVRWIRTRQILDKLYGSKRLAQWAKI